MEQKLIAEWTRLDSLRNERNQMLSECALLLGERLSWHNKLQILRVMGDIRADHASMDAEARHLMGDTNGEQAMTDYPSPTD